MNYFSLSIDGGVYIKSGTFGSLAMLRFRMLSTLAATLWLTAIALASPPSPAPDRPLYKVLTGFPEQLNEQFTPDTSLTSRGCVVENMDGDKKNTATNGVWEGEVPVDSWPFTVTICTKLPDMIKVLFTLEKSPISQCYDETIDVNINSGMPYPCRNYVFCNGTKLGTLKVQVSCDPNACPENNFKIYMEASFPTSTVKLFSSVATTNPVIGQPVTIQAKLLDTSGANVNPLNIASAVMDILMPEGNIITKVMEVLKDGSILGKFIPFLQSKNSDISNWVDTALDVFVKVSGASEDEVRMYRTIAHLITPALQQLFSNGKVSVSSMYTHPATNSQMVKFTIPVRILKTHVGNNYRYFTEVWGTDANGTEKAVCWITGLTDVQLDNSTEDNKYYNGHFDIEMDTNWMIITETLFPLHFRNFSIEETSGFVELVQNDRMEIDHDPWLLQWTANKRPEEVKITREMMEGYNPALYNSEQIINSKLLLVHGYCSSGDAFPTDEFTDYAVFRDYEQSHNTDEFAQLIDQYARSQDIDAYSIVAHSQGGMAALHLFAYYHSGLDLTTVSI